MEDDFFDIEHTCCFSGHRPEKLVGNGDLNCPELRRLLSVLKLAILETIEEGYTCFLTGMARGIDMWAARFVLEIKVKNPDIKLGCIIPFKGQSDPLCGVERYDYNYILNVADKVVCLSDHYTKGCMKKRNQYLVDNSSKLIAVVSNFMSGTGQTIRYAQYRGKKLRIIDINRNREIFSPAGALNAPDNN